MSPSASYVGTTAAASTGLSSAAGALGTTVSEAKRELSYLLDSYNTNTDEYISNPFFNRYVVLVTACSYKSSTKYTYLHIAEVVVVTEKSWFWTLGFAIPWSLSLAAPSSSSMALSGHTYLMTTVTTWPTTRSEASSSSGTGAILNPGFFF